METNETTQVRERLAPRIEEKRLIEIATTLPGKRIAATSTGRGQAAETLAGDRSDASVTCWYLDGYVAELAKQHATQLPNLSIVCQSDWPDGEFDLALVPLGTGGEVELTRDILQSAYNSLAVGGKLVASVDNAKDKWLHDQLKNYEKSVKVRPFDDAIVYFIEKSAPLKKVKDFSCDLTFRDCDSLIHIVTRPGVFSHRQLDNGARQLLDAVDVFPEARLIDIGCGSGSVAIGLAARDPSAQVYAIDSNARAVWCTREGAKRNGLDNLNVDLNFTGQLRPDQTFDMALANPPYYADFRIAQQFIQSARNALRSNGRLVLVTKQPKWYEENLPELFNEVEIYESKRYHIVSGVKPEIE